MRFHGDPAPTVRHAAAYAIGQLAGDLAPALQRDPGALSLCFGCLAAQLDDASQRVVARAALALTRLCDPTVCDFSEAVPEAALHSLLALLRPAGGDAPVTGVQLSAITALASIAQVCGPAVCGGAFYDALMPVAKELAVRSSAAAAAGAPAVAPAVAPAAAVATQRGGAERGAARLLRGKALECIVLVGVVAGAERFAAEAKWLLDFIVHLGAGAAAALAPDDDSTQVRAGCPAVLCSLCAWLFVSSS